MGDDYMKMAGGFHHIAMKVKDFDKVVDFYVKGLGFTNDIFWGEGDNRAQMIDIGNNNYIEIFAGGTEDVCPENPGLLHIALRSDDCKYDLEKALNAGAILTMPVTDIDMETSPVKKIRIAFCKGLQGETIEFFEERD